jgi:hypothetical protein
LGSVASTAAPIEDDEEGSMAKGTTAGGKSEVQQAPLNPAAERRAILWSATAFLAVAVAGLLFAPGLRLLWVVLLVFGIAAVPQALRRNR